MMSRKFILILFALITLTCCSQDPKRTEVKVYPLTQAEIIRPNPELNYFDSLYTQDFIVYGLAQNDTRYIRSVTTAFIDSIKSSNPKFKSFQLEFYKKSETLDTSYRKNKTNELYMHSKDKLGEYFFPSLKHPEGFWIFYKNGEVMDAVPITIEDIPTDTTTKNKK